MKKVYIVLLFIISVLVAFFVTKSISGDKNPDNEHPDTIPVKRDTTITTDTTVTIDNPVDTLVVPNPPKPDSNDEVQKKRMEDKITDSLKNANKRNRLDTTVVKSDSIKPKKHVKISLAEVKNLIMTGKYTKDKRISKNYSIAYEDVSDDDLEAGLQQNLQYVQDRVAYGEDGGGWRGFEVVDLDYDSKGLVNRIVIRPIY